MDYFTTVNLQDKGYLCKILLVNAENEEEIEEAETRLKSLANKDRIKIFSLLLSNYPKTLSSKEIAKKTGINSNTIRFHLKNLRDSNLVKAKKEEVKGNIYSWKYQAKYCGLVLGVHPEKWKKSPVIAGEERPFVPKKFICKKEE